ncbi:rhodanese-like domain-containing protein [Sulfitobacter sp. S190]|uniref:rhodanese-like domain-containing protein n=1 Tax=Sulfitobacter sp. S190 TaxID=2867022 RepID=UPI0021A4479B|nr:rhodanese-like domain-containing protein [Sulfitobacter sp. S190]UWR22188.1 rhodanese-like domain-containing protein [Sulfitobacter sp. S190]
MKPTAAVCAATMALLPAFGWAADSYAQAQASFIFNGARITIAPGNPQAGMYAARFAALPPVCEPACLSTGPAAKDVETVDEAAVLAFLVEVVGQNDGLMVDARMPQGRAAGFIPGSVSLPHETVAADNRYRDEILKALGVRVFEDLYNFSDAQALVVFDAGPTQNDAQKLIGNLLAAGYPPQKIRYYRGGMQVWSVLGLTIQEDMS